MQAHSLEVFILAKIVFYPKNLFTILYCCLLIIASIITMFSFQGAFWISFSRNSMKQLFRLLQSISWMVESTGIEPVTSCLQGRRSPSWANPPYKDCFEVVGQNGLEPSTSRLSVVCSSQLSYWPIFSFHIFLRYIQPVPSKLNNASIHKFLYPCTDLRTLLTVAL